MQDTQGSRSRHLMTLPTWEGFPLRNSAYAAPVSASWLPQEQKRDPNIKSHYFPYKNILLDKSFNDSQTLKQKCLSDSLHLEFHNGDTREWLEAIELLSHFTFSDGSSQLPRSFPVPPTCSTSPPPRCTTKDSSFFTEN